MYNIFKILTKIPTKNSIQRREEVYKNVFLSPGGQEILKDLMKQSSMFSANVPDRDYVFTEGKRSIVYYILNMLYNNTTESKILEDFKDGR